MISEILRTDIESFASRLRTSNRLFDRTRHGEVTPTAISTYLGNMTYLIQEALAILCEAEKRACDMGRHDLAAFYNHKIVEENGHHEWAQNDIASLNALFSVEPPAHPSRSIVGMLGYLRTAIHEDPAHYLAYLLFTEYLIVLIGPEWLALLESCCGVPSSSMTVVARHVELDKHHVVDDLREIDELVRDPSYLAPLRRTLQQSMRYFEAFCDELCDVTH